MKKPTKILAYLLLALLVTGCSWLAPHKRDIQQGNLLDAEAVEQLEIGMRQDQVKFLLGTPLLAPLGKPEQWDYVYQMRRGQELLARKRVSVFFEPSEDHQLRVARIEMREHKTSLEQPSISAEAGVYNREVPPTETLPEYPGSSY